MQRGLRVGRGRAAERLSNQCVVVIVAVRARAATSRVARHAAEGIIAVRGRAIARQIACWVIVPAAVRDLVGSIVRALTVKRFPEVAIASLNDLQTLYVHAQLFEIKCQRAERFLK